MKCSVSGGPAICSHYGAVSCRACSAFFRRRIIECREIQKRCNGECGVSERRSGTCTYCRFQKCLNVRMRITAVYSKLKLYGSKNLTENVFLSEPLSILEQIQDGYQNLQETRKSTFGNDNSLSPKLFNYQKMNQVLTSDFKIIASTLPKLFESITNISCAQQQKQLLQNFLFKFFLLDNSFKTKGKNELVLPDDNFMNFENIYYFYSGFDNSLKNEQAVKVMSSYWTLIYQTLVADFKKVRLDIQEFLFLAALSYWDFGLEDQSPESVQSCRIMRNQVIKELSEYEEKQKHPDGSLRVGDVILLLNSIQKAVSLFEESREISVVYDIYDMHYVIYDALSM